MSPSFAFAFALVLPLAAAIAAEPQPEIRPIPPPGIEIPAADRTELQAGADQLAAEIAAVRRELADKPKLLAELPNVEIFHKAVDWALRYGEFFEAKQVAVARDQLAQGMARAAFLREGKTPWNEATGLVVRGYRSKIDDSVQPYGLVIPADWTPGDATPRRLDFWFRGRAEKGTELAFIDDRQRNKGEFVPAGAFVLHPFGRYCNANKFAGETDLFEALEDAKRHYPIDPTARFAVRGFSMGGAACWQFATHFPGFWAAAAPGAGFAETREFMRLGTPQKPLPPEWEQTLWRWYDSTLYAANLANVPTIAYSGEKDGQKQAADIMERFLEKEGLTIPHVIGPDMGHKYHPDSKPQIEEFVTQAVKKPASAHGRFVTYSLIYPEMGMGPIRLQQLEKHWERAEVTYQRATDVTELSTRNVAALLLTPASAKSVRIDGQELPINGSDLVPLRKQDGRWTVAPNIENAPDIKRPGVCGPIDHAFMSSFVMVRPTGKPLHEATGQWASSELEHAVGFWRKVFRGDAPVKDDSAISGSDIANSNLVLWGDPQSNAVLAKIADKLPVKWTIEGMEFGGKKYDAAHHMPALIFPNPLNPERYVVLNSGVTFREQALLNNADQTAKLPDWAIIDTRTPAGPRWPGEIVAAGFFDEQWR